MILAEETKKAYFKELSKFLLSERSKHNVYPPAGEVLTALKLTPFDSIKVVILGQDPYHTPGYAHGLAFSVKHGIEIPRSLYNIFRELRDDLGCKIPNHGNLETWASQGVLLLNRVLTVRESEANSHANHGWEIFTRNIISRIVIEKRNIVFLLWGKAAWGVQNDLKFGDNYCLTAGHPSPFSAKSFFGCRHFSRTNDFLKREGLTPIFWTIPS